MLDILKPNIRDLGDFSVRRVLPGHPRKMVGPFIFFDHVGPVQFASGKGVDVRPHPHIGLATVTYLFDGALMHRDSLGTVQRIEPGDVNWMSAGRGIVHSERTATGDRASGATLHGIQSWVALPQASERIEPAFSHHPKSTLPVIAFDGVDMRLIVGTLCGKRSPAPVYSEIFYAAAQLACGASFILPAEHEERGVYVVEGEVSVAGESIAPQHLGVLTASGDAEVRAATQARLMLLGGAKIDGERHIWWNFVASSRELIEDAKSRWRDQRFAAVPGETEFIPLPDN